MTRTNTGIYAALGAFFLWGILPLYWKWLGKHSLIEIISHRTVWSALVLWLILLWHGQCRATLQHLRQPRAVAAHLLSGLLLSGNWLLYVWATLNERILEGALGYYLNPFFNMLFGYLFFQERHNGLQKISIFIAMAGVACQLGSLNGFPWVAVTLALSFALYAVVRKKSPLASLPGLAIETALLLPIAASYLIFVAATAGHATRLLASPALLTTGIVTATPLLLFGFAARNISLTTLGVLQFLGPSLQFLIGWKIYHEPLSKIKVCSFALIWIAIALYIYASSRSPKQSDTDTKC
jgi:chloramphenicol-sensitive protein RarD